MPKKPHKHRDIIIAWADGEDIQYSFKGSEWEDTDSPCWETNSEYRIKPEVIRYRVALFNKTTQTLDGNDKDLEQVWERNPKFSKWLTTWIEVEV